MEQRRALIVLSVLFFLLVQGTQGALYGYYSNGDQSALVSIDPQTGSSDLVCDLSHLPSLLGASSSTISKEGNILFYNISASGNTTIFSVNILSCKVNSTLITGLSKGQDDVRDIKYDSLNSLLYMVFPNPFCMHGSLDSINPQTGQVISHLNNVVDPQGLSQTAGLGTSSYYFVGVPLGADTIDYQLNKVELSTGNITAINLANNNIDVGDMWGSNYTLNVVSSSNGDMIVGAVSPSTTTVEECSPSGFYSINSNTGNVSCIYGPIEYEVYPLAELEESNNYYYQVFNDANYDFYLYTFDIVAKKVVYNTPCKICGKVSVLSAL